MAESQPTSSNSGKLTSVDHDTFNEMEAAEGAALNEEEEVDSDMEAVPAAKRVKAEAEGATSESCWPQLHMFAKMTHLLPNTLRDNILKQLQGIVPLNKIQRLFDCKLFLWYRSRAAGRELRQETV